MKPSAPRLLAASSAALLVVSVLLACGEGDLGPGAEGGGAGGAGSTAGSTTGSATGSATGSTGAGGPGGSTESASSAGGAGGAGTAGSAEAAAGVGGGAEKVLYDRPWSAAPVAGCPEGPTQKDAVVDLGGGRATLVSGWMRPGVLATNAERLLDLVRWADRSTCSKTPLSSSCGGLISRGEAPPANAKDGYRDFVLVTEKLLLWFDFTPDHPLGAPYDVLPNGGGGQLRGVWPLSIDGSGFLNFANIRNASNWAPNMLLPGATAGGAEGSGLSAFLTDRAADDGTTYNVEGDVGAALAIHAPSAAVEGGEGTLHAQGFLAQAVAHFVDTRPGGDRYEVGAAGSSGRVEAVTTYRVAACDARVFVETAWRNESQGRVGPVVNAVMATNSFGDPNPAERDGNLLDFSDTSDATCVVRRRAGDTPGCHAARADFAELGVEHEYRSRANLWVPPPTMILRGKDASGSPSPWTLELFPLSGIVTEGMIFDKHSLCSGACSLVPAFDITLFNVEFWESQDPRAKVPDYDALPPAIERFAGVYYIKPSATLRARVALRFAH